MQAFPYANLVLTLTEKWKHPGTSRTSNLHYKCSCAHRGNSPETCVSSCCLKQLPRRGEVSPIVPRVCKAEGLQQPPLKASSQIPVLLAWEHSTLLGDREGNRTLQGSDYLESKILGWCVPVSLEAALTDSSWRGEQLVTVLHKIGKTIAQKDIKPGNKSI